MFNIFKKKTEIEKLEIKYRKLLSESYKLSKTNRKLSDEKILESNEILKKIDEIKGF